MSLRRSRLRPPGASPACRAPKVALILAIRSAAGSGSNPGISVYQTSWRRGRDSNPRGGYKPPTRFPVAFLRPARTPLRKYPCVNNPGGEGGIRPMSLRRSRLTPPQLSNGVPQGATFIREWGPASRQLACLPLSARSGSSSLFGRRQARVRIPASPIVKHHGGEGGIRTLGTVLPVQPLSRRLPSADSATSPAVFLMLFGGGSRI